jgi:hypothetical protein
MAAIVAAAALAVAIPASSLATSRHPNPTDPYITLTAAAAGGRVVPLINSGDVFDGVTFEGLPDGIGVLPIGQGDRYVDLYVNFEQSRVPFQGEADFEDSSVQAARLDLKTMQLHKLDIALPASAGLIRFCSNFMAGPEHGFDHYTLFTNEESNDLLARPLGQAGYVVALDTKTGAYTPIAGMGRHNHENSVVVPGGWDELAILSGDDTFNAPSSQLYIYTATSDDAVMADQGTLLAFRVTATGAGALDAGDAFNGANDYGDMSPGDSWSGEFITVPQDVARGTAPAWGPTPQDQLENWSNANNVFQFIRVEDIAYDDHDPRTVYFADTGEARALTDAQWVALNPANTPSGRLHRGPSSGPFGDFGRGRIFKMVLNADDPTVVDEFSILLDADTVMPDGVNLMNHPDNVDTSTNSLMVQEDASNAKIWRLDFGTASWSVVATVDDTGGESSGIVDMSRWLGAGWWALDVQAHSADVDSQVVNGVTLKREDGQLMLMQVPGS